MSETHNHHAAQELTRLLWKLSRDGGQVLVRGPDQRWHASRLPPERGSGSYLEVLAGGELRQWRNDGSGRFQVLRAPGAHAHPTPPPGPTECYMRRYSLGVCDLETRPLQEQPELVEQADLVEPIPARARDGTPGTCSSSR